MVVKKILPDGFGSNSYILTKDGKNAVIVDCAEQSLYSACLEAGLTPCAVLLTHGHFDHVGGCGKFFEKGVPIYCGELEKHFIFSDANRSIFGGVYIPEFEIYKTLKKHFDPDNLMNPGGTLGLDLKEDEKRFLRDKW